MTNLYIARMRLQNQLLAQSTSGSPADIVRWFGAVQAQDYPGSLRAVGLRMQQASEQDVERAVIDGTIVRSRPMRNTLHYTAAEDVRWMLQLGMERAIARAAFRWRQLGLDEATFARSNEVVGRALQGGKQLTRVELAAALNEAGISTEGQQLIHILGRSSLDGPACHAARRGKQPTFALLDDWVPQAKSRNLERDDALAELARRYFTSHGPATLQDFIWWSGLVTADARAGLEAVKSELVSEIIEGQTYWLSPATQEPTLTSPRAWLLPVYDEYMVAYKDRSAMLDPQYAAQAGNGIFTPTIVVDGLVVGNWRRTLNKGSVIIAATLFNPLPEGEKSAIVEAANCYGQFLDMPVTVRFTV